MSLLDSYLHITDRGLFLSEHTSTVLPLCQLLSVIFDKFHADRHIYYLNTEMKMQKRAVATLMLPVFTLVSLKLSMNQIYLARIHLTNPFNLCNIKILQTNVMLIEYTMYAPLPAITVFL